MKIQSQWDNDNHSIIRHEFERGWSWTDFHQALDTAYQMMDTVNQDVHVILDFRTANLIPNGALTQLKMAYSNPKHSNIGKTVVVGANSFMQALVSVGTKLAGNSSDNWEVQFANNLDEAYQILDKFTKQQDS